MTFEKEFEQWWEKCKAPAPFPTDFHGLMTWCYAAYNAGRNAGLTEAIEASAAKKNIGPFTDEDGTKYYRVGGIDDAIDAIRAKISPV